MSKVNPNLYSKLRETFIVLNDDLERVNSRSKQVQGASTTSDVNPSNTEASDQDPAIVFTSPPVTGSNLAPSGSGSGSGSGRGNKRPSQSPHGLSSKRTQS